jgi:hypothetical protein
VKKLMGKLVNREPVSDMELDELSSSAWLSIDGTRSILDITRIQGSPINYSPYRGAAIKVPVLVGPSVSLGLPVLPG